MLSKGDGEMNVEVGTDDLSNAVLGKTGKESCCSLWSLARLSMAGWKRWGQNLHLTILRVILRRAIIAPQQTMRCLNSS